MPPADLEQALACVIPQESPYSAAHPTLRTFDGNDPQCFGINIGMGYSFREWEHGRWDRPAADMVVPLVTASGVSACWSSPMA
jgi:hypothetical protein